MGGYGVINPAWACPWQTQCRVGTWGDLKVGDTVLGAARSPWDKRLENQGAWGEWGVDSHWQLHPWPGAPRDPPTPPGRGQGTPRPPRGCSPSEGLPQLCQDPDTPGDPTVGTKGVPHTFGGLTCVVGGLGRQRLGGGFRQCPPGHPWVLGFGGAPSPCGWGGRGMLPPTHGSRGTQDPKRGGGSLLPPSLPRVSQV